MDLQADLQASARAGSRGSALEAVLAHFDRGDFTRDLARRVAHRTESQDPASGPALQAYLADEIGPALAALGFDFNVHPNPQPPFGPLFAEWRAIVGPFFAAPPVVEHFTLLAQSA